MRDLAIEQGEVFRQPPKLADVPIDRRALIVWKLLSGHPHPATSVEQIGVRAFRDQLRVQDRIHVVLESRAMPHDLVARDKNSGRSHHALAVPRSAGHLQSALCPLPDAYGRDSTFRRAIIPAAGGKAKCPPLCLSR
ncbi:hypothetical protein [Bradyrhizobium sp. RT9a]|uniref:hypothetical protein n=1 Tax=Bradyrhizobium sp. RT9a TaxID=3156384 RepID=UPI0033930195